MLPLPLPTYLNIYASVLVWLCDRAVVYKHCCQTTSWPQHLYTTAMSFFIPIFHGYLCALWKNGDWHWAAPDGVGADGWWTAVLVSLNLLQSRNEKRRQRRRSGRRRWRRRSWKSDATKPTNDSSCGLHQREVLSQFLGGARQATVKVQHRSINWP